MARPIWTGSIAFGLVYVPVELYSATHEHRPQFHQLQKGSKQRVRYKRVSEQSGEEVDYHDIVKGFEVGKGRHVVVTAEELEAVSPANNRTIEIEDFVDLTAIDPLIWNKSYFLGPSAGAKADKPYVLLRRALETSGKVAIGRFVMRTRQYLVTIRPFEDVLLLETMYFADEIRSVVESVKRRPDQVSLSAKEMDMAKQLIASLTARWDHSKYHDTYQEQLLQLVERKRKGEVVALDDTADHGAQVIDLMDALKRSLEAPHARSKRAAPAKATGVSRKEPGNDNLRELTKEELYERASKAEIPGRSKMSRTELISALRKVS